MLGNPGIFLMGYIINAGDFDILGIELLLIFMIIIEIRNIEDFIMEFANLGIKFMDNRYDIIILYYTVPLYFAIFFF